MFRCSLIKEGIYTLGRDEGRLTDGSTDSILGLSEGQFSDELVRWLPSELPLGFSYSGPGNVRIQSGHYLAFKYRILHIGVL